MTCPSAACVRVPSLTPGAPPRAQRVAPRLAVAVGAGAGAAQRAEVCEWLPPLVVWREVGALAARGEGGEGQARTASTAFPASAAWGPGLARACPGLFFSMALAFREAGLPLGLLAHLC